MKFKLAFIYFLFKNYSKGMLTMYNILQIALAKY